MIKRFPFPLWALFALIFAWKAVLVVFFALPAPSNDSFFYDGAVVNVIEAGEYYNPAIRLALPISGTQVFSAYPPLYQASLWVWMKAFGTTAFSAMLLHLILFGAYMLTLLALLRRLGIAAAAGTVAALFLFAITFTDRPDSLAHLLGVLAVYCWVRAVHAENGLGNQQPPRSDVRLPAASHSAERAHGIAFHPSWSWGAVFFAVLALATGLQIGALYLMVLLAAWSLYGLVAPRAVPWVAVISAVLIPGLLISLVVFGFPHLWQGFLEHAKQTPSFTGFRLPAKEDILKMGRNVPGILMVGLLLLLQHKTWRTQAWLMDIRKVLLLAATGSTLAIVAGAMFVLTPNALTFSMYLQPLIVGLWFALVLSSQAAPAVRWQWLGFVAVAILAAIRTVGLSTWGIAGAVDYGYRNTLQQIRTELRQRPPGSPVVLSSAYLYGSFRQKEFQAVHSDWLMPGERTARNTDWEGVLKLRPSKIILTPFDYYRRYEPLINSLRQHPELMVVGVTFHGSIPPPDAFPKFRRVIQHLSWAPVVIELHWKSEPAVPN